MSMSDQHPEIDLRTSSPAELADAVAERWLERQDDRPIDADAPLSTLLAELPPLWLRGIALRLGLEEQADLAHAIAAHLADDRSLAAAVAELPELSRAALQTLLEGGGAALRWRLIREYGDEHRDGWFWDAEQPESPLGLLRSSGLLHVGRAERGGRRQQLAVVPAELRARLQQLLAGPAPAPSARRRSEALDEIVADLLVEEEDCALPLQAATLERFFRGQPPTTCGDELWAQWNDLRLFFFYLDHLHHEIAGLADVRSFHLSELVHEFAERRVDEPPGAVERRHLLKTIAGLYAQLALKGALPVGAASAVQQAAQALLSGQQLGRIERPAPHGGEPLALNAHGQQLTINDLWLLIVAEADCKGDLTALMERTDVVPDGEAKLRRLAWLREHDHAPLSAAVAQRSEEQVTACRHWFYRERLSMDRSW